MSEVKKEDEGSTEDEVLAIPQLRDFASLSAVLQYPANGGK